MPLVKIQINFPFKEGVEVFLNNEKLNTQKLNRDEATYIYDIDLVKGKHHLSLKQLNPLNQKFWWKSMLVPIAFLQHYLLRYELIGYDDNFAQYECDFIIREDAHLSFSLEEIYTGKKVPREFYLSLILYNAPKKMVQEVYYKFKLIINKNAEVLNIKSHLPVSQKYLNKWRLVRVFPGLFTYGLFSIIILKQMLIQLSEETYSSTFIVLTSFAILLFSLLIFETVKKVFNTRSCVEELQRSNII